MNWDEFKTKMLGVIYSKTMYFGSIIALAPMWYPSVEPMLTELLGPSTFLSLVGIATVVLRYVTTKDLADKGL